MIECANNGAAKPVAQISSSDVSCVETYTTAKQSLKLSGLGDSGRASSPALSENVLQIEGQSYRKAILAPCHCRNFRDVWSNLMRNAETSGIHQNLLIR